MNDIVQIRLKGVILKLKFFFYFLSLNELDSTSNRYLFFLWFLEGLLVILRGSLGVVLLNVILMVCGVSRGKTKKSKKRPDKKKSPCPRWVGRIRFFVLFYTANFFVCCVGTPPLNLQIRSLFVRETFCAVSFLPDSSFIKKRKSFHLSWYMYWPSYPPRQKDTLKIQKKRR